MNTITMEEMESLARPRATERGEAFISIYMPTVEKTDQVRQNPIRFKNLLDDAHDRLIAMGMEPLKVDAFLERAAQLLRDEIFWQRQDKGLAAFLSKGQFQYYQLPMSVAEQVIVNDRFYLKPMLPMLHNEAVFYILALSQKHVRLMRASEHEVSEVNVPGLPKDMQDALGYETFQQFADWESNMPQRNNSGEPQTRYNGHGEGDDLRKDYILNYFRIVNQAVSDYLIGVDKQGQAPLILACVEYLQPIYKEANTYRSISDKLIPGNPDDMKPAELKAAGWELIKPTFETGKGDIYGQYKILAGRKDNRAVKDVEEIIKAAPYGRVQVLFVDKNAKKWGTFDEINAEVHFEDQPRMENQDLLDYAAIQTLLHGGTVLAVDPQELPESGSPAAAILRY